MAETTDSPALRLKAIEDRLWALQRRGNLWPADTAELLQLVTEVVQELRNIEADVSELMKEQ